MQLRIAFDDPLLQALISCSKDRKYLVPGDPALAIIQPHCYLLFLDSPVSYKNP